MRAACKKILAQQFDLMREREAGTCSGEDIEDLHRMRVATRRMRSCLRHFEDAFADAEIAPHRDDLRQLGRLLGEVRDIDTCIRTFQQCEKTLGQQVSEAVRAIVAERRSTRESNLARVRTTLLSEEYIAWKHHFLEFLEPSDEDAESLPLRRVAPDLLLEDYERILRYRKSAWKADPPKLHKLRIRCKRLRYLSEFLQPIYDRRLMGITETILEFQDILGEVQDHFRDYNLLKENYDAYLNAMTPPGRKKQLNQTLDYLEAVIETNRRLFLSRWRPFVLNETIHRFRYILKTAALGK